MSLPARLSRRVSGLLAVLDRASVSRRAMLWVPLALGLLSLRLGQDNNWDLMNYHLYNPFAFLNGKIGLDLAPAQWQSYFNPTLDLLYYGLTASLPAPVAGFLMAVLHGLNFLLLLGIARLILPDTAPRAPLLLAIAGVLGTAFLAQLGNSMGDNMSSLFVLGSLLLLMRGWAQLAGDAARGMAIALAAGLAMGLGCGLKLTNATYALALCVALLTVPLGPLARLRLSVLFGIGVVGGMGLTAGHWFLLMYQHFGNPLFPQFNNYFRAPLAMPIGIGDTNWLPRDWTEKLLWPFLFALDAKRVGELPLRLWLWPLLYVAMLALAVRLAVRRTAVGAAQPPHIQRQRLLLVFFALAYLLWLNLFAIYRYLVPLELLAPLVLWLVLKTILPAAWATPAAALLITVGVVADLPRASWGHARWTAAAFTAQVPPFANPAESMVFTVPGDPPLAWLVTRFPRELAFVSLGAVFPESAAYVGRVGQMAAARKGPFYVMLHADHADPARPRDAAALLAARQADHDVVRKAQETLGNYHYALDTASCKRYPAFIGKNRWTYQLCTVAPR